MTYYPHILTPGASNLIHHGLQYTRGQTKYALYLEKFWDKYCKLQHEVIRASWNEDKGSWDVEITRHDTGDITHDTCDIFINACGVLGVWRWPSIPGLMECKGSLLHTATWDRNVDLEGKHVGLIGNEYILSIAQMAT